MSLDELKHELGFLAMKFRGRWDEEEGRPISDPDKLEAHRRAVAAKYAAAVIQLVESGVWDEFPGPEEMLPDEYMPGVFFTYWKLRQP